MKLKMFFPAALFLAVGAYAQGTFIYDQQSSTNQNGVTGDSGFSITTLQPIGQSFAPALSAVGFVQLKFVDLNRNNGIGATVYVNLRSGSITGTLLGSTSAVTMPDDEFDNVRTFLFPADITVTPGTEYFFQPVVQAGDADWTVTGNLTYGYASGDAFFKGNRSANGTDLWFREGVVPEPSTFSLLLVGLVTSVCLLRRRGCTSA